jgi:periplasmic divalent cation tolerance protein
MTDYISVYLTVASRKEAEIIAVALIRDKLAACVNILPAAHSMYRWKGKLVKSREIILVAKSRKSLFARIEKKVKSLSSYECPCVVAWPITAGYKPYLDWVAKETKHPRY